MQAQATVAGRVLAAWERGVPCIDHKIDIASEAACLGAVRILFFFAILTVSCPSITGRQIACVGNEVGSISNLHVN